MHVPVVIQAGGKGTRLYPFTQTLPKPLMPIGGMPILEIVVRQLAAAGFRDIHVTIGHLGDMIRRRLGDGAAWDVRIRYWEEREPLGTMGPLRKIAGLDSPFLVLNGDLLTNLNFQDFFQFHLQSGGELSIAAYRKSVQISLGVLDADDDGRVVGFREKPTFHYPCSMGIYGLSPSVLSLIPKDRCFGFDDLMYRMLEERRAVHAYAFHGEWLDIGRPEDLAAACDRFERRPADFLPEPVLPRKAA